MHTLGLDWHVPVRRMVVVAVVESLLLHAPVSNWQNWSGELHAGSEVLLLGSMVHLVGNEPMFGTITGVLLLLSLSVVVVHSPSYATLIPTPCAAHSLPYVR